MYKRDLEEQNEMQGSRNVRTCRAENEWSGPVPKSDSSLTDPDLCLPPALAPQQQGNVPRQRRMPNSLAQTQQRQYGNRRTAALQIACLPEFDIARYRGVVVYASSTGEVEDVCKGMLRLGVKETGWDLEWKVDLVKNSPPRRVALMQICYKHPNGQYTCLLLHVAHSSIPASLYTYLIDATIVKAGVGADNDAIKMQTDFGIRVANVLNLYHHPYVVRGRARNTIPSCSLQGLTAQFLGRYLPKEAVRTGNWEQKPLSHEQKKYAAADAVASLRLYEILEQLRPQCELEVCQQAAALTG